MHHVHQICVAERLIPRIGSSKGSEQCFNASEASDQILCVSTCGTKHVTVCPTLQCHPSLPLSSPSSMLRKTFKPHISYQAAKAGGKKPR